MKEKNKDLELNQMKTPLAAFMKSYNKSLPAGFPCVSVKILKNFRALHPVLFKHGGEWSIEKHRKKVMDWLPLYTNSV